MRKLKQTTALFLAAILLFTALTACGSNGNSAAILPSAPDITSPITAGRDFTAQPLGGSDAGVAPIATFDRHNFTEEILTPRDGYILAPTMFGTTGIDVLSQFFLRTPYETQHGAPPPAISIDGQPAPTIVGEDASTFVVTPAMPLSHNSVYIFRLRRIGMPDITWAFQTTMRFEISATLPRHQATNVPVQTGIEIYFSIEGDTNIADYFHIYPAVEGRFIRQGNRAIFMPTNPLEYLQVYTVTVLAGVTHDETGETTTIDHTFSFETARHPDDAQTHHHSNVNFHTSLVEFPTFATPTVFFWHNYGHGQGRPQITMNLYRIADRTQAIAAVNNLINIHHWAHGAFECRLVDTTGLERVSSTVLPREIGREWNWQEEFTLPGSLPAGFYVLSASTNDSTSQMLIQITDLAVQIVSDSDMTLAWVNCMNTGQPADGAMVFDPLTRQFSATSEYGIAIVNRGVSSGDYLIVTAENGAETVVFAHWEAQQNFHWWDDWGHNWDMPAAPVMSRSFMPWQPVQHAHSNYWGVLQLDRTLFQRSDTLHLWGFVQNRRANENISHVTAVITEQSWWWDENRDTLVRQNIPVVDGAYSGIIRLPHLDPGSYVLNIYHGSENIGSVFFSVQDYVKPPYQLMVSANHAAVFAGEEITFTARTEFFEGTPVPDLELMYNFWAWELNVPGSARVRTNAEGVVVRTARPTPTGQAQGVRNISFSAEATLPEIGWVRQEANVRVFVNDIHVRPRATRDGENATLTVNVNDITIDRINDGTATHWGDFLCDPVQGQQLAVRIYQIYWEPIRIGERYCHINRQVVPRYRYERRERFVQNFNMTTDADGFATRDFTVPNRRHASYEARITTTDGNGRTIRHNAFIGRDWSRFHDNAGSDRPFLDGARPAYEGYQLGDLVELTIMQGAEPLTGGNFLFVVVQGGILSYHIGTNPLEFTFDEQHVPNVQVFAYHFNGHIFTSGGQMSQRLHFNNEGRELALEITTCQETYRPGQMATITVAVTCQDGNPKAANVNISLVDEALFALMDYTVDTLAMLYGRVADTLRFSMATHRTFVSDGIDDMQMYGGTAFRAMGAAAPGMAVADAAVESQAGGGSADHVRERFEDTAKFISLQTNSNGIVTFTFQLPDNITSWRITASAVSSCLYAGNTVQNLRVTQPMFVHYTLNRLFLTGDTPAIGVNAFGTSLSGGEEVIFEVWRECSPNDIRTATGVAFARTNILLWELEEEGEHAIFIRATAGNLSDTVRHNFTVTNSHRMVETATFYEVSVGSSFVTNSQGLTNITFSDHGRGRFLWQLTSMRWVRGARIEGLVASREATRLLGQHFPDTRLWGESVAFNPQDYQTASGGMAILPHSDANLAVTVQLIPFILEEVNQPALRRYLQSQLGGTQANRILALYGLALLGEPVLLELQNYAAVENLSVRNLAYVAMGLVALGETGAARQIYNSRIMPYVQRLAPYYRANVPGSRNDILDATSAVAMLAAKLGMPQAQGLHNYATMRHSCNFARTLEQLTFIANAIENMTGEPATITYTLMGETVTRELGGWSNFTLRIPTENMNEFAITAVTGSVGAVSITRTPLEDVDIIDNDITVTRQFFRAGSNVPATTFAQDELIRVQITIDYSRRSMYGSYVITDFLPAGLVAVENSARFGDRTFTRQGPHWRHVTQEGQRVTFFDFNSRFTGVHVYYYYARVVNPGTFRAEGTLVQSMGAREYMTVGACAVITIE